MNKIYCSLLLLIFSVTHVFGQPWMRDIPSLKSKNDSARFVEIQKAFKNYWNDREIEKGHGYNPFKRWEWFMEQRIWGEWKIPNRILWEESTKKQQLSKTKSAGGNWTLLGPVESARYIDTDEVLGSGRIDCIAFHPVDTNIIWVGSPTGGLWKTTNAGDTWYTTTDNLPSLGISDIVLDPGNPDIIYLATGDRDAHAIYSAGILKSTDGGDTWNTTGLSFDQAHTSLVNRLLINPDSTNILIAGRHDGIYRSNDSGDSWVKIITGHYKDLEFKPGDPSVIYAATYTYGGNAWIYKSADGGSSFSVVSTNGIDISNINRIELAVTPADSSIVYALCSNLDDGGLNAVCKSTDFGENWEQTMSSYINLLASDPFGNNSGGQGWYDLSLAASPIDTNEVYVGGINIWKSTDGGKTWNLKTNGYPRIYGTVYGPYVHVDHHILKYHPGTGTFFSGHDGGIDKTYDGGKTWVDITDGLEILQIYRIGSSATKRDLVLMGSQDNSTIQYKSGNWKVVLGGDGMECIVDYSDTNTIYSSFQFGNMFYSNDGGLTIRYIKPEGSPDGEWITPYIMHPRYPNIIYAGFKNIYRSINRGSAWDSIATDLSGDALFRSIAISPSNPDYIYAATRQEIWRTTDGGNLWTSIKTGLPQLTITYISISQHDPNKIWITFSGYTLDKKVYTSDDGGTTWENYTDGLPNVPVNCIVYENNSNMGVYAGTDLGVYYRNKSMDEWIDFSEGLPNVIVNELEIYYPDSIIRAGTYGRGLWESELYTPLTPPLFAEFSAEYNSVCFGSNLTFRNLSSPELDSLKWDFGQDADTSSSTNADIDVSYSASGDKTVSLIVYKEGDSDTTIKHNYINVINEFSLSLNTSIVTQINLAYPPSNLDELKKGDKVIIEATGASVYSWLPIVGLDTTSGPLVIASPQEPGMHKYIVTAKQDNCYGIDSVQFVINTPPSNDDVCNAKELTFGTNSPFDNKYATIQQNEPMPETTGINACTDPMKWCEEGGLQNSVWYKFTGPASGIISIDSEGMDNQIAVYDSPACDSILFGIYTLLAANDDYHDASEGYAAAIAEITGLTEGKTYWVQVDGSAGGAVGSFNLILRNSPLSASFPESDKQTDNLVSVYPNPNNGTFDLSFNLDEPKNILLKVFKINGQMVYSENIERMAPGEVRNISLKNPLHGLYLMELIIGKKVVTKKIMIE